MKLHFFEPDRDAGLGSRVFTVSAEGRKLTTIDIRKEAGAGWAALSREFRVRVRDGHLDLVFASVSGKALVSAIEVIPQKQDN